tara:strand:- start:338 stop:682 length:345 start_codon:yes stop_codon:yes gene_type:complete
MSQKHTPHKNTEQFIRHLEIGLTEMGYNFTDFNLTPVTMNNGEDGYVFSQVENDKYAENTVCVLHDGISFPDSNVKMMFSEEKDQPPSLVAILFLTSILQKKIISPSCPHCDKE